MQNFLVRGMLSRDAHEFPTARHVSPDHRLSGYIISSANVVAEIYPKDTYEGNITRSPIGNVLEWVCFTSFFSKPYRLLPFKVRLFATLWPVLVESSIIIIPTCKKIRWELVLILDLFGKLASLP
jgi:hypothetical protein